MNFKVAELFCSNRFGDAAVDMGFEHGFVVDYATGWDMEDEEQMQEVERRVMEEEPVLFIGSPMCRFCDKLIELVRVRDWTRSSTKTCWNDACEISGSVSECTRCSETHDDCSCMSIRGQNMVVGSQLHLRDEGERRRVRGQG